jgi:predicted  nucleic acid-binding Zn-ribbon protein
MAKKTKATSAEEKLRALYDLQLIDSRIDRLRVVRGELPLEVEDLADELAGLFSRLERLTEESDGIKQKIQERKESIIDSGAMIKRFEEQQNSVRNNREFESLNKEIEYQSLEIQLSEKRIKEAEAQLEQKGEILTEIKTKHDHRAEDLKAKQSELDEIIAETRAEEEILSKMSGKMSEKIDDRLLQAYLRIRGGAKNGMAVVPIEREASAGSYIKIPPQRILDVGARKRIIVDEHSGRILVDQELAVEEQEKVEKLVAKELKAAAKA